MHRVLHNDIRRLLRHDVNRRHDEEARNLGKDRCIHDTQPVNAADAELRIKDRHWIIIGPDRTRARGMVAPGVALDEMLDLRRRIDTISPRPELVEGRVQAFALLEDVASQGESFQDSLVVFVVGSVLGRALVVVVEVDIRHIPRVCGSQHDGSSLVSCVRLQSGPCEE